MKKIIFSTITCLLILALSNACKPKLQAPEAKKGNMDATHYVAIGDGFTAGYADGALYRDAQENSYVTIIAEQLKAIGGGDFHQPLMEANSVGVGSSGKSHTTLGYATDCKGVSSLKPIPVSPTGGDTSAFNSNVYGAQGAFNNMGVPDAKAIDLSIIGYGNPAKGIGNYNRFFARMTANQTSSSILSDAQLSNPTFFSLFIGVQDVLEYALNGGASGTITPPNGLAGIGFDGSMNEAVAALSVKGAKGVIATIPDITRFPYFTTIPYNGLTLDSANAATLNSIYNPLGFYFQIGANPFMIEDPSAGMFGVRPIKANEYILLNIPLDSVKCLKLGSVYPIPNRYVLTETEVLNIHNAINSYNSIISTVAANDNLAIADINSFFTSINNGIIYNGISLNSSFVAGGVFSLDGIRLTPRGNALLANEFIKAINTKYQSTIPQADATKYKGIVFP